MSFVCVRKPISSELCMALAMCGMFVWWDSFHEIGRFLFTSEPIGGRSPLFYNYVSCLMQPIGLVAGSVAVACWARRGRDEEVSPRFIACVFAVEALLHVAYYVAVTVAENLPVACALHCAISACFMVNLTYSLSVFARMGTKTTVLIVAAYTVCMGLVNYLAFSFAMNAVPLSVTGVVYGVILYVSYRFTLKGARGSVVLKCSGELPGKPPLPLFFHLVAYGAVFGVLHVLGGNLASSPFNINLPSFFSCLIAVGILLGLFLHRSEEVGTNTEIWSKLRSSVFPLAVIGFMMVPLVFNNDIALAVMGAGQVLYDSFVVVACVILIARTYVAPVLIVTSAFFFKGLGMAMGVAYASFGGMFACIADREGLATLGVVLTLLLTAATFWIGSDETIRKVWGLRRNLSPKKFRDVTLRAKCERLAKASGSTAKESEVLLMVAQDRRASEIKDDLHVSINTVRSHIQHAYAKLDVHSVDELSALLKTVVLEDKDLEEGPR